jgi:DNA-binding response OmpR family regulator
MTLVQGALGRSKPETVRVDISRVEGEITSSFLVAIQTARSDGSPSRSSEAVARDYSVNLLPFHDLIARVCAALKRNQVSNIEEEFLSSLGDLHLDASRHLVQRRSRPPT